jgi:hypothetical protein
VPVGGHGRRSRFDMEIRVQSKRAASRQYGDLRPEFHPEELNQFFRDKP